MPGACGADFRRVQRAPARFMSERSRHPAEPARQARRVSFRLCIRLRPTPCLHTQTTGSLPPPAMGAQRIRLRIRLSGRLHATTCNSMRQGGEDFPRQGARTAGAGSPIGNAASGASGVPARNKEYGEGGIRTLGPVARTPVFETGPIGRSGTSPKLYILNT